ncbi:hypothetical protein TNCT_428181 [Trichonephila clavata]|uniref:Uncharacterized protein n=1 Tax=Trichonephila clavata TaxID=2740835 RepID=A0A8X6GJL9_TRICU|nr:hypothetical protein TNCT_428181 [Trichonephila clavata]
MHRISSRYHVPKGRPSKRKMQALLKAKKRWASGEIELEHQSLHVCENDPDASGNVSSNYENNEVNTYPLNSSELNAATERKLSLLSSHTSAEHVISEQNDPTYVLVDTNVWKNLLSTVKCPECDMNNLNIIKTTQLGMASKLELTILQEAILQIEKPKKLMFRVFMLIHKKGVNRRRIQLRKATLINGEITGT